MTIQTQQIAYEQSSREERERLKHEFEIWGDRGIDYPKISESLAIFGDRFVRLQRFLVKATEHLTDGKNSFTLLNIDSALSDMRMAIQGYTSWQGSCVEGYEPMRELIQEVLFTGLEKLSKIYQEEYGGKS